MTAVNTSFVLWLGVVIASLFAVLWNVATLSFIIDDAHFTNHKTQHLQDAMVALHPLGTDGKREIAGLSCARYGGPRDEIASEMVYWSDIQSDAQYASAFKPRGDIKYISFEPDHAGFNNLRMKLETVIALALAMGRTLVLPPKQQIPFFDKNETFSFEDFFYLESIAAEHAGLGIITMDEFLRREAATKRLLPKSTTLYPPMDKVNWDGKDLEGTLWPFLRDIGLVPSWDSNQCVLAFPSKNDPLSVTTLRKMFKDVIEERNGRTKPHPTDFVGKPVSVDAAPMERLREMLSQRERLCLYDTEMQNAPLLHIRQGSQEGGRLLTHFYGFLFFEDWRRAQWMKRFIRDHVRYNDEIMCAAATIVNALRDRAGRLGSSNHTTGLFDTLHVRRGDFGGLYPDYVVDGSTLYENSKRELVPGSTLYIATDEPNRTYFEPLAKVYDICFFDDFRHLLPEAFNWNLQSIVEQVVAARGRTFFGVFLSTYTGYINRLRGYYSVKEKQKGWQEGVIASFHYASPMDKYAYRRYFPFVSPSFMREYPMAWRDIDVGIEELEISFPGNGSRTVAATGTSEKARGI